MNVLHAPRLASAQSLLILLAACASAPPDPTAPVSLLGTPLEAPQMPEGRERWLQLELDAALAAWEVAPSEMHTIWVGRRLAYLGLYAEAIAWFEGALATFPDSYRLRRHLGHRLLTIREIDATISVLIEARALAAPHRNRLEPDGAPGPSGEPRSSTHGNIDYHLALAFYVRGDFDRAADLWMGCITTWARNDDAKIAALHWAYVSLGRAGREAEAEAALHLVAQDPDIIENFAYADLVRLYRGQVGVDAALTRTDRSASLEYGLARSLIRAGDAERGLALLHALAERPSWPSFGVLAAEADVAALEASNRAPGEDAKTASTLGD